MKQIYFVIRKITVAPILAFALLTTLHLSGLEQFAPPSVYFQGVLFLTFFPLLAYPMQKHIPKYQKKGREGQRTLAMIFAVVGYLLGITVGLLFHAPAYMLAVYLEYLLSGLLIFVINLCFHKKASGHACGAAAPIILFASFGLYTPAAIGVLITLLVYLSSIKTKRHTLSQLIGGSIVPIFPMLLLKMIFM